MTYTTDKEGKFDFTIRYPKIYAQWLNVQIGASSTIASLPFRTTYNVGLPSLSSDYSTDGTYGPNSKSIWHKFELPIDKDKNSASALFLTKIQKLNRSSHTHTHRRPNIN